jgi:hypothetical protein
MEKNRLQNTISYAQDAESTEPPPPRPPKPSHLLDVGPSYLNLTLQPGDPGSNTHLAEPPSLDAMYDFPRSHNVPQVSLWQSYKYSKTSLIRTHKRPKN